MWVYRIEEVIFFKVSDVFNLIVRICDESRQAGEGDSDICIEMPLGQICQELLDTPGLFLNNHHRQTLRTIQPLALHYKLRTENYDFNIRRNINSFLK